MPIHDWTKVEPGIYHDFHHGWIQSIKSGLNRDLLPPDAYALAEQIAAGFGPDVLTLQEGNSEFDSGHGGTAIQAHPKTKHTAEHTPYLRLPPNRHHLWMAPGSPETRA